MSKNTPPAGLGPNGKRFYKQALRDFTFGSESDLEVLGQAAACVDRIAQAAEMVKKLGVLIINPTSKAVKPNPACSIERDNKVLLARLCRELGMLSEQGDDSRPPRNNRR